MNSIIHQLAATIADRKLADTKQSYTASLLARGPEACVKKFGEEAFEFAIAAIQEDDRHTIAEAADVIYHLLVALEASGISLQEVEAELARRTGQSGIEEKASRKG
ncbi:phosphoribosyl-ATP diphosphatase [bacterium]|nr:phosphoribosyl-ATP diphosphatase [bacterium]